jgi:hypothetical protein
MKLLEDKEISRMLLLSAQVDRTIIELGPDSTDKSLDSCKPTSEIPILQLVQMHSWGPLHSLSQTPQYLIKLSNSAFAGRTSNTPAPLYVLCGL